jgi:hypothetical protein
VSAKRARCWASCGGKCSGCARPPSWPEVPAGLASRKRGQPGNRRIPDGIRRQVLAIIRKRYADFGPTLTSEKLAQCNGLPFSRCWPTGCGKTAKTRLKAIHQPRNRCDCVGELAQIDGSEHWWFEGRGPQCKLLVFVDDATSRLMALRFVETEGGTSTKAFALHQQWRLVCPTMFGRWKRLRLWFQLPVHLIMRKAWSNGPI